MKQSRNILIAAGGIIIAAILSAADLLHGITDADSAIQPVIQASVNAIYADRSGIEDRMADLQTRIRSVNQKKEANRQQSDDCRCFFFIY